MHRLLRALLAVAALAGTLACSAQPPGSAAARNEYRWALSHGACECDPLAYAPGSAVASLVGNDTVGEYVKDKIRQCAARQFVVVAFGDGTDSTADDLSLAQRRADPVVLRLKRARYRHLDTIAFTGAHVAHPSTVEILCPTDPFPAKFS